MLLKVCGNNHLETFLALDNTPTIDFLGLIFYTSSKRNVTFGLPKMKNCARVGVFVNAEIKFIQEKIKEAQLDYIQLHGDEDFTFCKQVQGLKPVIKAFRIDSTFDFQQTSLFESCCKYFLFDTHSPSFGGSGKSFDWTILNQYKSPKPFFLSGGIQPTDVKKILQYKHPTCVGIDINSGFELTPGLKDPNLINKFIKQLKR